MKTYLLPLICLLLALQTKAQLAASITSINASCNLNNGFASGTATGAETYTYKWSNGDTSASANNLAPGAYTVTVYGTVGAGPVLSNVYTKDFQGANTWQLNIPTGGNGTEPNIWAINDTCGGAPVGSCSGHRNGDRTLHVHATKWAYGYTYTGAYYNAIGSEFSIYTDLAAQSPAFSTIGSSNLYLGFDYIGYGEAGSDMGSCYFSIDSGNTFFELESDLISHGCGVDGGNANPGTWAHKSYHLPAYCSNVQNCVIRFRWQNNGDDYGEDPSIGVNNIVLGDSIGNSTGTSDSIVKTVTIAAVDVQAKFEVYHYDTGIYYAHNESTGAFLTYHWVFGDGTDYYGCCPVYAFATAGYWSVCLTAKDRGGCSSTYCDSLFYNAFKTDGGAMTEFIVDSTGGPTSVKQLTAVVSMEVFPNPANSELNVIAHNFQPVKVVIYAIDGSIVKSLNYQPQIDITSLPSGLYFIEVKDKLSATRGRFLKL